MAGFTSFGHSPDHRKMTQIGIRLVALPFRSWVSAVLIPRCWSPGMTRTMPD